MAAAVAADAHGKADEGDSRDVQELADAEDGNKYRYAKHARAEQSLPQLLRVECCRHARQLGAQQQREEQQNYQAEAAAGKELNLNLKQTQRQ